MHAAVNETTRGKFKTHYLKISLYYFNTQHFVFLKIQKHGCNEA